MKKLFFILLLALAAGCSQDNDPKPVAPIPSAPQPGDPNERAADCDQRLAYAAYLESQNRAMRQTIALIHAGFLPNTGCDRLGKPCSQVLEQRIALNNWFIRDLRKGCE